MDHCPYGSLIDLVGRNEGKKGLHWKLARHIAGQIVAFLEESHKVHGIAHNRLTPKVCVFDSLRRLKICDFRHAQFIQEDCSEKKVNIYKPLEGVDIDNDQHVPLIEHGLRYCSPEFIEEGKTGVGADLWALGLIIFYMLTGRHAFADTDSEEICYKIMSGDFIEEEDEKHFGTEPEEKAAVKDLIIKLTQMLPHMRIGSGEEGTPQSMDELKGHPWFTKIGIKDKKLDQDPNYLAMKMDVTKYSELPIPTQWPADYQMKFRCNWLDKYYKDQSFQTPSTSPRKKKEDAMDSESRADMDRLQRGSLTAEMLDLDASIANVRSMRGATEQSK